MLRVFVSSTSRDLKRERETLLGQLEAVLSSAGMENFVPDGKTSQEIGIEELRRSDVIIFLISPHYGSLIEECKVEDCRAECPMKTHEGTISFTHCEFKVALAEGKPHQAYLVDKGWNVVKELRSWKGKSPDWRKVRECKVLDGLTNPEIAHYFEVSGKVWDFKEEVRKEFCPRIKDVAAITHHLADNLIDWYSSGNINLKDFCGRRKELKDLYGKMSAGVEVHGVGGIGKTTLVHVALLVKKLKGEKIITIGTKQSYLTGSGYRYFREKCKEEQHEIVGGSITLDDIMDALSIHDEVRLKDKEEKTGVILNMTKKENIFLFIDDFHLADRDVRDLAKKAENIVISSKKRIGITRNELPLFGIIESEREELISLITGRLGIEIAGHTKEKIKKIAEGHPVSTEILLRNSEKIDFQELEGYRNGLDFSNPEHVKEFLERVVEEVLSGAAFSLLRDLSVINTDLENNLDRATIEKTWPSRNFGEILAELIDSGMLRKKEQKEGIYRFSYRHIQEAVGGEKEETHERALEYYKNKIAKFGRNYDDVVEIIFHRSKSNPDENLPILFATTSARISPVHSCFRRLIDVGEGLRNRFKGKDKAYILEPLGGFYKDLGRFEDSEEAVREALEIRRKLAEKSKSSSKKD